MRTLATLFTAGALVMAGALAFAGDGQGPITGDADNVRLADLDLGTYWYGAEITKGDLIGKVVLVELWGS